jgi:hypothetical protein
VQVVVPARNPSKIKPINEKPGAGPGRFGEAAGYPPSYAHLTSGARVYMDTSERPKLPPAVYKAIESSQIKVDEYFWKRLLKFQVSAAAASVVRVGFPDLEPLPPVPRKPDALRSVTASYTRNLFAAEALRYSRDERLRFYLTKLGERIVGRVMDACQGRSKRKPLGRSEREPVRCAVRRGFSGEKGLWSVAEEALLPRSAFGGAGVNGSGAVFVCGGFA